MLPSQQELLEEQKLEEVVVVGVAPHLLPPAGLEGEAEVGVGVAEEQLPRQAEVGQNYFPEQEGPGDWLLGYLVSLQFQG